jgi:hypothetical protein
MVGKVIQGLFPAPFTRPLPDHCPPDLLKLSDETDLDILNVLMEVMVEQYSTELLPVATQLTARLVCSISLNSFQLADYMSV